MDVTAAQLAHMRRAIAQVPAWQGMFIERQGGDWTLVLGTGTRALPDLEDWTDVEVFNWLSDAADILLLAREAETATAPDGPPLVYS